MGRGEGRKGKERGEGRGRGDTNPISNDLYSMPEAQFPGLKSRVYEPNEHGTTPTPL